MFCLQEILKYNHQNNIHNLHGHTHNKPNHTKDHKHHYSLGCNPNHKCINIHSRLHQNCSLDSYNSSGIIHLRSNLGNTQYDGQSIEHKAKVLGIKKISTIRRIFSSMRLVTLIFRRFIKLWIFRKLYMHN
ncbi:unnamed protein product [Blepharisma stoltei]|uniref:Uncharacterized protein n=1 Tax=Blepharisma stoltei TaxID=1481888 RepID=A0AAU9J715_9CILI|nr:unnamed protein product [Blepharisma stoltei]